MDDKERQNPPVHTPFVVSLEGFTYLGVKIPPTTDKIVPNNYNTLTDKVTHFINRWTNFPISLTGRTCSENVTYPNFCIFSNLSHLLPHLHFFIYLKRLFQTLYGTINVPGSGSPYYIYHMKGVDYNYQILSGTIGLLKLEQECFIL